MYLTENMGLVFGMEVNQATYLSWFEKVPTNQNTFSLLRSRSNYMEVYNIQSFDTVFVSVLLNLIV